MKRMLIVLLLAGCSKSAPPSESPSEPEQLAPPQGKAVPECVDDSGEVVECESDADCCEGFSCAADPEVSHRRRVCLYAF